MTGNVKVGVMAQKIEQHLKSQGVTCPTALHLHTERAKLICPGDTERYRVGGENPNALPINTMMG